LKTIEKKPSTEMKINNPPEINRRERNRSIVTGTTREINSPLWGWRNEGRSARRLQPILCVEKDRSGGIEKDIYMSRHIF
jgi:hypothetical protein